MQKLILICGLISSFVLTTATAQSVSPTASFQNSIRPLLETYCYDCHSGDETRGNVAFDQLKSDKDILNHDLWLKVLKNVRANLMPPAKKKHPSAEERQMLETWIKYQAFGIDPKNLDPGRVTLRRLNRAEYRNTIRDLIGVDFDTQVEFPSDDTGYGFDNIADVLTLSPMLMEKYINAAETVVKKAVPVSSGVVCEQVIQGDRFHEVGENAKDEGHYRGGLWLPYKNHAVVTNVFKAQHAGHYQIAIDLNVSEKYVDNQFDYNRCRLIFKIDGQEKLRKEYARETGPPLHYEFKGDWAEGEHQFEFELQPLTPDQPSIRALTLRIDSVTVRGPYDKKFFVRPANYAHFFPKDVPAKSAARRAYARELLKGFADKAFRRPTDDATIDRLTKLAEQTYQQPGQTFEFGIAHAMTAVLASPRFLFHEESVEPGATNGISDIDEYSLASRLSYFLWSSMPDEKLFHLAASGTLRKNLSGEITRMLADPKSMALVQNFAGQWLQARDISTAPIDARSVLAGDSTHPEEFQRDYRKPLPFDLDGEIRQSMREEVDSYFSYVMRENRDVTELVNSDYTFLNERLARFYGLTNLQVRGQQIRKVTLPPDCPRGGVLTMGGVLVVTSNPTRTSPVKRGLFILDSILGTPSPPPPPNIPPLEDAAKGITGHSPTLRETLAVHRENALCSSCHNRLDPPGLALENFNALGLWRETQRGEPIDAAGKLITGETFSNIQELKHVLATNHREDFYRTLTTKLLTYALGRGLEYYDVETVDQIVDQLKKDNGHFSALLTGIIESTPFQKSRQTTDTAQAVEPSTQFVIK